MYSIYLVLVLGALKLDWYKDKLNNEFSSSENNSIKQEIRRLWSIHDKLG